MNGNFNNYNGTVNNMFPYKSSIKKINDIDIDYKQAVEVRNTFKFKYCDITNSLVNLKNKLQVESPYLPKNKLYYDNTIYYLKYINFKKDKYFDLKIELIHKHFQTDDLLIIVIPLLLGAHNEKITGYRGLNGLILRNDLINDHKHSVWSNKNIVNFNLSHLCPVYEDPILGYITLPNTEVFITKPRIYDEHIGNKIKSVLH